MAHFMKESFTITRNMAMEDISQCKMSSMILKKLDNSDG